MRIYRLALTACVALAATGVLSGNAGAQDYPNKPLRLIVPFPPGGGNDILARSVGQRLAEAIGQQIIVDNRGGAGGLIGAELAAKAVPDGYTWSEFQLEVLSDGSSSLMQNLHKPFVSSVAQRSRNTNGR